MSHSLSVSETFVPLTDLLAKRALLHPEKPAYQVLHNGDDVVDALTYEQLFEAVQTMSARLQQDLSPGDRALLLYPAGLNFLVSFLACLMSGIVAIPAPAPDSVQFKRGWPRLRAILEDAAATHILTQTDLGPQLRERLHAANHLETEILLTDEASDTQYPVATVHKPAKHDLTYLQYTSGSQSSPKGVMISHSNLLSNIAGLSQRLAFDESSISLNWMPHHHDYGLVQGLLMPLYCGGSTYIMSPTSFIRHPMRWLSAMSRFGVTHSQGTNFAYAYVLRKFKPNNCADLDLSQWKAAAIAAERINPDVIQKFQRTFLQFGFRPGSVLPGYGLAEATLAVSTRSPAEGANIQGFEVRSLQRNRVVQTENQTQRYVVGCGSAADDDTVLRIVDPGTARPCAANEVGEIWVSGPGIALGYWKRGEDTEKVFRARIDGDDERRYLRTGDMGFVLNDELFFVGRVGDLIVVRGQNHHPSDIEFAVEASHQRLRDGRCAAFSIEGDDTEQLVVVAEVTGRGSDQDNANITAAMTAAIGETVELAPQAVVLIRSGSMPVTSSGKIQRAACRQLFLQNKLDVVFEDRHETEEDEEAALPPPPSRKPLIKTLRAAPAAASEEVLRPYLTSLIQDVLRSGNLDWMQDDQNLLDLGIDSIATVEIRVFLEDELDLEPPMDLLYRHPTLGGLIAAVTSLLAGSYQKPAPGTLPRARRDDYTPDMSGKERLLNWRLEPEDRPYVVPVDRMDSLTRYSRPITKEQMHQKGHRAFTEDWAPATPIITPDTRVLGMGSCFTRDIILWLAESGYNRQFPGGPYDALLRFPSIGNNAYLEAQFKALAAGHGAYAANETGVQNAFLDAQRDEGKFLQSVLRDVDVLFLSFAALETWYDADTQDLLMAPMLLADYKSDRNFLSVDDHAKTLERLERMYASIRKLYPELKIVTSLSIGRSGTFREMNALNAASIQDATIRSAVSEFMQAHVGDLNLFYFPAHELFQYLMSDTYREDNAHATSYATGKICAAFGDMFCDGTGYVSTKADLDAYNPYFSQMMASAENGAESISEAAAAKAELQALQAHTKAIEARNEMLQTACDERLEVIQKLDAAVRDLRKKLAASGQP